MDVYIFDCWFGSSESCFCVALNTKKKTEKKGKDTLPRCSAGSWCWQFYCCFTAALLLLYCCLTAAILLLLLY